MTTKIYDTLCRRISSLINGNLKLEQVPIVYVVINYNILLSLNAARITFEIRGPLFTEHCVVNFVFIRASAWFRLKKTRYINVVSREAF